ncbi:hypothetical protein OPV22_035229 [Ensete ventricosum]|uniref:Uncharacterized protein n=1 Tax=Ensete ventricosum TaxID=4639 RepID=A0AAX5NDL0_ENSVE|nr:hypothetical protein OPV22_035229 [Ensete ventricosum]
MEKESGTVSPDESRNAFDSDSLEKLMNRVPESGFYYRTTCITSYWECYGMAKGVLEHNPKLGYPLEHKGACGYGFGLLFSPNSSRPAVPTWGIWYCPLYAL